jgi:hypothetical protein
MMGSKWARMGIFLFRLEEGIFSGWNHRHPTPKLQRFVPRLLLAECMPREECGGSVGLIPTSQNAKMGVEYEMKTGKKPTDFKILDFFGLMRKYVFLYVYFWREKKMCDA